MCIPKKSEDDQGEKKYRIVVDFRALNLITKPFVYPIPRIDDIMDNIGNSKFFSTIDLKSGFFQIPIALKDAAKTAFSTAKGHYEFLRMPMGLKNSPSTFQKLMNTVIYTIQPIKAFVYLDDIVVFGDSIEEHTNNLLKVFNALRNHNLKIEPSKCKLLHKEITYLGHTIKETGIKPTQANVKTILDMHTPKTLKEVRSFLGMINFYGKFIPNVSDIRKPLHELLKKNAEFIWDKNCDEAFKTLKNLLISEPILVRPNFEDCFVITTDASDYALGAVLSNEKTVECPIAYASRSLVGAEKRYHPIEKELLAIVWAVEHFKHYIYGNKFIVYSDHRPLVSIWRLRENSPILSRLRLRLQGLECEIRYKKGKENVVADFLSRLPELKSSENQKEEENNTVAVFTRQQKKLLMNPNQGKKQKEKVEENNNIPEHEDHWQQLLKLDV